MKKKTPFLIILFLLCTSVLFISIKSGKYLEGYTASKNISGLRKSGVELDTKKEGKGKTKDSSKHSSSGQSTLPQGKKDYGLEVHFIDVGQGDAILICTRANKNVLIDGGEFSKKSPLVSYLKSKNIKTLDLVIGSHPHEDHIGGLVNLFLFSIPLIYSDPGYPHPTSIYIKLLDLVEKKNIKYIVARKGYKYSLGKDTLLSILLPDDHFIKGTRSDVNNNSVIAKLSYREIDFLFTGDAEFAEEKKLINSGADIQSEILKIPHHGGSLSSSTDFIKKVSPEVGIIMCGMDNPYGHPHDATLRRYEKFGVDIYRTDLNGNIVVQTEGKNYRIITER